MHLPFCARRCPYCDFPTAHLDAGREARYLDALAREARDRLPPGWRARTVFFGGGTPLELTTPGIERLVEIFSGRIARGAEVTAEANPRTLLARKLRALRDGLGLCRLSLGAQSFRPRLLAALGRFHRPEDVRKAVAVARAEGVRSLNLDLIFAIPGQRPSELEEDLDALLSLRPDHVSAYCLTVEEGTAYGRSAAAGRLRLPSDGVQARYFARVRRRLRAAGFQHYEISNFARPGHRCRHNQRTWRNHPYYGLGNGAASHVAGVRMRNHPELDAYVEAVETGGGEAAVAEREELPFARKVRETAYLALRTSEGLVRARFLRELGVDPERFFARELARLRAQGLLVDKPGRVHLSGRGVRFADAVAVELL